MQEQQFKEFDGYYLTLLYDSENPGGRTEEFFGVFLHHDVNTNIYIFQEISDKVGLRLINGSCIASSTLPLFAPASLTEGPNKNKNEKVQHQGIFRSVRGLNVLHNNGKGRFVVV
ncbi:hypothetical protein GOP47_0018315 [Adiantum capillus-veneris]|uniref:Uncharacterized protein n=1 Tax=Adiantum capillus-veneris TaxID=13818 RepID=A0A9D4UHI7_ADICA|nr:hypothetical protein GOP47_0018315 [Adiantum capillus-veneris]